MRRAEHHVAGGNGNLQCIRNGSRPDATRRRVWHQAQSKAAGTVFLVEFSVQQRVARTISHRTTPDRLSAQTLVCLVVDDRFAHHFRRFDCCHGLVDGLLHYWCPFNFALLAIRLGCSACFCDMVLGVVQDWYNDTYEVTDTEIIDRDASALFPNLLDKMVRRQLIDINDISYTVPDLELPAQHGQCRCRNCRPGRQFSFDRVKTQWLSPTIRRRVEQYYER